MRLPFLDRSEELRRLRALVGAREGSFGALFGRRRCGKSRLLEEVIPPERSVYYVADDRESSLQRASLAEEIARVIPGFGDVTYPDWEVLLRRWWEQAKAGDVLTIDEFPTLAAVAREVPSLLQKQIDGHRAGGPHLLIAGSSQRMMQGLVLDRSAPLFGRAAELLRIGPLPAGLVREGLGIRRSREAVRAYAVWGGIPRYWELAADHRDLMTAITTLVLSPLGVLHEEPRILLLDDLRDTVQAASILSLIGQGCHRLSEIAGRMGKPATALSRPLQRLMEMGLVRRDLPFWSTTRDTKRTLYQIADPFLRFWFRFVEPNRSRLEAGQAQRVAEEIADSLPLHVGTIWEELARDSVARLEVSGRRWRPASRWWGTGLDRRPMELDIVAASDDGTALLFGEVKWTVRGSPSRLLSELHEKATRFPLLRDREVCCALWLGASVPAPQGVEIITPDQVLDCLS